MSKSASLSAVAKLLQADPQRQAKQDLEQAQAMMLAALEVLDRLEMHIAAAHLSQAIAASGTNAPLPEEF